MFFIALFLAIFAYKKKQAWHWVAVGLLVDFCLRFYVSAGKCSRAAKDTEQGVALAQGLWSTGGWLGLVRQNQLHCGARPLSGGLPAPGGCRRVLLALR